MSSTAWPLRAQPEIFQAGRFQLRARDFSTRYFAWHHSIHLHDYHGVIELGDTRHRLEPGSFTVSPAGVPSRYHLPVPGEHWCIHFQPCEAGEPAVPLPEHLPLGPHRGAVAQAMQAIAASWARRELAGSAGELAHAAASARLQALLLDVALLHHQRRDGGQGHARVDIALDRLAALLHERLDQALAVGELAEELGLSQNYLARSFRRRYGCTIQRYLLQLRIARARYLLDTTTLPIGAIAAQVGMADAQHFNKRFREICGMSPSRARELGAMPH